jgi:5-methylthioadenosine/S-adenosylhomocysteine deaminase
MKADILLQHGLVVTMDGDRRMWRDGAVAIEGGEILAVGPSDEISSLYDADEICDCSGLVLTPGLVNAHTHIPMSLLRGLSDDLRLDVWLLGYMMPVEREFVKPDFVREGALLSLGEMLLSGITTFCDMYYFEEEIAKVTAKAGVRAVLGQTILKFPSPDSGSYDEGLERARRFIEEWKNHPLITPAVAPHAPYTATDDLLEKATQLAVEHDVPLHIHLSETAQEVKESYKEHKLPPIAYVDSLGVFQAKTIAAHCVHAEEEEVEILAKHHVGVAHNPSSNMKLSSGVAPISQMLKSGVAVGVGTDGPASNNNQNMLEELHLASLLAKVHTGDPTALPAETSFAMATIGGAKALHLDHITGSLEPGKRADIVAFDMEAPHLVPLFDLGPQNVYSHLVYTAQASDVKHVWVDGKMLVRDRNLLTVDMEEARSTARKFAVRISDFVMNREQSLLDKLLAVVPAGLEQRETFEIQVKAKVDDLDEIERRLQSGEFKVLRRSVRQQFDTYFLFDDGRKGFIRYREDNVVVHHEGKAGLPGTEMDIKPQYSLTLLGPTKEREYANSVILSRSRFVAPAVHSLRFYREYFRPDMEKEVIKWRTRYHVEYGGEDFAINLDKLNKPAVEGGFVEIKIRTWSREDAERKAGLVNELLQKLGIPPTDLVRGEYVGL